MRTLTKAEFKRWQTLPLPSRPLVEGAESTRLPECRGAESAGPTCAKPRHVECRSRQTGTGPTPGDRSPNVSTIRVFHDHD